jgi:ankyrin repeat protein
MQFTDYDEFNEQLKIVVPGVRRHDFFDVPRHIYDALLASPNQPQYFNSNIWNRFEHRTYWRSLDELFDHLIECFLFEPPVTVATHRSDADTPLHVACIWGDLGAVELLLESGADPDAAGDLGCTPLYHAVNFGFVRCAGRLLQAGASPDALNELNTTPRGKALEEENPKMVALFSNAV